MVNVLAQYRDKINNYKLTSTLSYLLTKVKIQNSTKFRGIFSVRYKHSGFPGCRNLHLTIMLASNSETRSIKLFYSVGSNVKRTPLQRRVQSVEHRKRRELRA